MAFIDFSVLNFFLDWILLNIIIPIFAVFFIFMFFIAQYYLIKLYVFVIKTIYTHIVTLIKTLKGSEKFMKFFENMF